MTILVTIGLYLSFYVKIGVEISFGVFLSFKLCVGIFLLLFYFRLVYFCHFEFENGKFI
jgi:hypothetical protein